MSQNTSPAFGRAAPPKGQNFRKILESIAHTRGSLVTVFSDFCRMVACAYAMKTREDEYMRAIKGYSRQDLGEFAKAMGFLVNEMEANPFADILGPYYTEIASPSSRDSRGEFYTPPAVATLLGQLSFDAEAVKTAGLPVSVCDPAGGSGGMILACAQALAPNVSLMRATLQDINPIACDMAYINTTLWSIPAEIILGNTLKAEVDARWINIHWARVDEDGRRRMLRVVDAAKDLFAAPANEPGIIQTPAAPEKPATVQGTFDFFLE